MLEESDVLVESFRPGVLEKLFEVQSADELLDSFPRLVIARVNGYGSLHKAPGHDINFMAASGVLGMMSRPEPLPAQFADIAGGSWPAALQIVAALFERERLSSTRVDRKTQRLIEVNITAGAHSTLLLPLSKHALTGETVGLGADWLSRSTAPYGVFKTSGGEYLVIAAVEPHYWASLCEVVGLEPCDVSSALTPNVCDELAARIVTRSAEEWESKLQRAGVPASRVVKPEEAAEYIEKLTGEKVTITVGVASKRGKDSSSQPLQLPRLPLCLGVPSEMPAPPLGAHSKDPFGTGKN